MKRTLFVLVVTFGMVSLPLTGCGEDNEKSAGITGTPPVDKPGDDTSPEGRKKQMLVSPGSKKSAGGPAADYPKPKR